MADLAMEAASIPPPTARTDEALKVRFSAAPGKKPEVELTLVWRLCALTLLANRMQGPLSENHCDLHDNACMKDAP